RSASRKAGKAPRVPSVGPPSPTRPTPPPFPPLLPPAHPLAPHHPLLDTAVQDAGTRSRETEGTAWHTRGRPCAAGRTRSERQTRRAVRAIETQRGQARELAARSGG